MTMLWHAQLMVMHLPLLRRMAGRKRAAAGEAFVLYVHKQTT